VVKHPDYYRPWFFDFTPPLPPPVYFPNVPAEAIRWNDGMQSRSRHSRLLLFTRNTVVEFEGRDMPGYCVTGSSPMSPISAPAAVSRSFSRMGQKLGCSMHL
jgi:hypothetical protein